MLIKASDQPFGRVVGQQNQQAVVGVGQVRVVAGQAVELASADVITRVGQLTYTIILTNSGNSVAANVALTDPIPVGTVFVPGSFSGSVTYNPSLNQIEWSGSVPAGGSVRFSCAVTVNLESEVIVNKAYISLNGVPDRILTARTRIIPASSPMPWHIYLPLVMRSTS